MAARRQGLCRWHDATPCDISLYNKAFYASFHIESLQNSNSISTMARVNTEVLKSSENALVTVPPLDYVCILDWMI